MTWGGVTCEVAGEPSVVLRRYGEALRAAGFYVASERPSGSMESLAAHQCELGRRLGVWVSPQRPGASSVHVTYWDSGLDPTASTTATDARLPEWVPAYPGTRMVTDRVRTDEGKGYGTAVFRTWDDAGRVREYYRQTLPWHGLQVAGGPQAAEAFLADTVDAASPDGCLRVRVETDSRPQEGCRQKVVVSWQDWQRR